MVATDSDWRLIRNRAARADMTASEFVVSRALAPAEPAAESAEDLPPAVSRNTRRTRRARGAHGQHTEHTDAGTRAQEHTARCPRGLGTPGISGGAAAGSAGRCRSRHGGAACFREASPPEAPAAAEAAVETPPVFGAPPPEVAAAAEAAVEASPVSGDAVAGSAGRCGSCRRSAACFGRRRRRKRRPLRKPPQRRACFGSRCRRKRRPLREPPQRRRLFGEAPPPEAPAAAEAAAEAPPVSGDAAAGSADRCGSRRRSAACFGRPPPEAPAAAEAAAEAPPVSGGAAAEMDAAPGARGFHGPPVDSVDHACGVGPRVMERPWIPWTAPVGLACAP